MRRSRLGFFNRMSLAWQIVLLLGVALLPIGGLAVFEAFRGNERAASLASSELLADAQSAAERERLEIAEGFGVVKTLARSTTITNGTPEECTAELAEFIGQSTRYIFASYTDESGRMACSSIPGTMRDFSEDESYISQRENPRRAVRVVESGNVTSRAVLIISHPVYRDGVWRGTLSMSVPREVISVFTNETASKDVNVALIDEQGQVLSRSAGESEDSWWLPVGADRRLDQKGQAELFESVDAFGAVRTYVRVPIVEGEISGLFSRPETVKEGAAFLSVLRAILLPGLVWVLCIALAYVAMRRLVITGIHRIQSSVIAFRGGDRERALRPIPGASGELEDLSRSFAEMARAVDEGEQELSGMVEEKTVLLLEVYHRVKNNLQLIISIMNIQLRGAQDEREKMAIRTLRERVMGLALVHQRLYETPNLSSVPADRLVREITSNLSDAKQGGNDITILTELDEIKLHPDQAVPFSLLITEAMMNALNYTGPRRDECRIRVDLTIDEEEHVTLRVSNTLPEDENAEPPEPRSGMGQPLMRAFVMQLAGEMSVDKDASDYTLSIRFKRASLNEEGGQRIGMPGRAKVQARAREAIREEPAA